MSCTLLDLGCHMQGAFWGLVNAVPWWVWLVVAIAGAGAAYKLGGWPAMAALAFGYGMFWGHKTASTEERLPDPDTPRKPKKKRRPTIFDTFNR